MVTPLEQISKVERLRTAAENDERPLVKVLKDLGYQARKNDVASKNREIGDVIFKSLKDDSLEMSFEVQVSVKHSRFSYKKEKVTRYVGPSGIDKAFVMLGCKSKDGTAMLYVMAEAKYLNEFIKAGEGAVDKGDYYVFSPENLGAQLKGRFAIDLTIEDVAKKFIQLVDPK